MESSQLSFTQVLDYLNKIQKRITEVRLLNESTCHDINQLLKKPWPNKSSTASSSATGTVEGSRGPASGVDRSKENNVFSTEEKSMLAEVDSVLAQAQKLRQFQSKVKIKQTSSSNQENNSLEAANALKSAEQHTSVEIPEPPLGSDPHPDNQPVKEKPINQNANKAEGDVTSDVAIISARDLDRLLKKDPLLGKVPTPKPSRPTSGSNKTANLQKSKTASNSAGSKRPVGSSRSLPRKESKTSSAEIGKHVSRPASRYGETQSRYMQSAKAKIASKEKTKQISQVNGTQAHSRQRSAQSQAKLVQSSSKQTAKEVTCPLSGGVKNEQHSRTQRTTDTLEVDKVTKSISQLDMSKGHAARYGDAHGGIQQEVRSLPSKQTDPTPQPEKIPFMLRQDGSNLTIPSKLKKQWQHNAKLRDKLTSLVHDEVSRHSDHFISLFGDNPSSNLPLDAELQKLITEYQYLIKLTTDVRKQLQAIHGTTQWEDVYYLQTMSTAIRQRQEEMRKLFSALKEGLHDVPDVQVSRISHKSTNSSPFIWHQTDEFKDECLSLNGGNILQYSSRAELLKWNEIVYRIQHLQQEKVLQEVSGDAILDLLSSIDPEDPSYPALYRIAHGLILNSGTIYPSMISDEERAITPVPGY